MKLLIVKSSALGDVIHALPVLYYLKNARQNLEIHWLVEDRFAPLLEDHPHISLLYRVNTKDWRDPHRLSHNALNIYKVLRDLRKERYDAVLDLQGNIKSGFFTLGTRAPLRYGFDKNAVREWPNLLSVNKTVSLASSDYNVTDRYLKVASTAFPGGSFNYGSKTLEADPRLLADVKAHLLHTGLSEKKLVLLHFGTTWKTKRLNSGFWKDFIHSFKPVEDVHFLLTWGNDAERRTARLIQNDVPTFTTVWERSSLKGLAALLAVVDLVVGGDTGPVHIAAALGTPTVSLFRATDRFRNAPKGRNHIALQSPLPCSPCLLKSCPKDEECSRSIHPLKVKEAVLDLLARVKKQTG